MVGVIYIFLRHIKAAGLEHPIFGPKWAMSPHLNHRGGPRIRDNVLRVTQGSSLYDYDEDLFLCGIIVGVGTGY